MQRWMREKVQFLESQMSKGEGKVRIFFRAVAQAENEREVMSIVGGSWEQVTKIERQEWRLSKEHEWRHISVVRVFPGPDAEWKSEEGSGLPIWSGQVPPEKGTREREEFEACCIAGWEDDTWGKSTRTQVMRPDRMKAWGFQNEIVRIVEEGMQMQFDKPVQRFIFGGEREGLYRGTRERMQELEEAQEKGKSPNGGEVSEGPLSYRPWVVTPMVAVEREREGVKKTRICYDHRGSGVNGCLKKAKCSLPNIDSLARILHSDGYIVQRDGKAAFGHIPINARVAECFGFLRLKDGSFGRRRQTDFGTTTAPAACQNLSEEIVRIVGSKRGVGMVIYVDDWAVSLRSKEDSRAFIPWLDAFSSDIGYYFDPQKSREGEVVVFLGVEVSCVGDGWVCISKEKANKYSEEVREWKGKRKGTKRELAGLAGRLNFAASVTPGGASRLMALFRDVVGDFTLEKQEGEAQRWEKMSLASGENERGMWKRKTMRGAVEKAWVKEKGRDWQGEKVVSLSQQTVKDLEWWERVLGERRRTSLHLRDPQHKGRWEKQVSLESDAELDVKKKGAGGVWVITSDACKSEERTGGGWWCGAVSRAWVFDSKQAQQHINVLEMEAVKQGLKAMGEVIVEGKRHDEAEKKVLVRSDNTAVVGALTKGASGKLDFNLRVQEMKDWCYEKGISLRVRYISTTANDRADRLSRGSMKPSVGVVVLSTAGKEWISSLLQQEIRRTRPGGEWETPATVLRREWEELGLSWDEKWRAGIEVASPLLSEVGECVEALWRSVTETGGLKGKRAVVVPADGAAQTKRWWKDFAGKARRERWVGKGAIGRTLRVGAVAEGEEGMGEWIQIGGMQMEVWIM